VVVATLIAIITACSSTGNDRPGYAGGSSGAPGIGGVTNGAPCRDWETRECGVELGTYEGYVACARGTQVCENGRYGACLVDAARGTLSVTAPPVGLPTSTHAGLLSVGDDASDCNWNVCNPYCRDFNDEPDQPHEAPRVDTPTGILYGGVLESSNLPSAFKNKGSLDDQCGDPVGTQGWNEACQFDQHCVSGRCTAFEAGESGSCSGVDITAPTSCVPAVGGYRTLSVCNRGTVAAPAGVKCYRYSGGSPQYPNDNPGTGDLVMTTAQVLQPGGCETQQIPEAVFGQNGIQSIGCNPPESTTVTATLGPQYPTTQATTSGTVAFTTPANAYAADDVNATAAPADPTGTVTGPRAPSANSSFGSNGTWTNGSHAYSAAPAGQYATATPTAPALAAGTIGPKFAGGLSNPASTADASFATADRLYAADGSYATATPSDPATVVTASPTTAVASASWSNLANAKAADGAYATATLSAAGTVDGYVSGFGFNSLPADAVLDSLEMTVKWRATYAHVRYSLTAQVVKGAANSAVGTALTKSSPITTETTQTQNVSVVGLTAADLSDANLKVRLRFNRASGFVALPSTAQVDHVQLVLKYHVPSTTASVALRNFGLGSVPSNATSVQLSAEVKWKASAVNPNVTLGLQAFKNWGAGTQAALGSELMRGPLAANTDYTDNTGAITVTAADLADTSFAMRLRVVRNYGVSGSDVTASVDYVRVTVTYTNAGATNTSSIFLKNFGLDGTIPSNATITSVTTSASWRLSAVNTHVTLGLQAYKAGGVTALGTEVTNSTGPIVDTVATQTVVSGVSATDLSDANFGVRVRVSRGNSADANPNVTAYLDYVTVTVAWSASNATHGVTYGNFRFGSLPSNSTITGVTTEVRWKTSVSGVKAQFGFQPYVGAGSTALGTEYVSTSPTTTATTQTQTLTGLSLTPTQLADGNFVVKLRVTRTTGSPNPDFTASVDFVRVTVTYRYPQSLSVAECNPSNNWSATKLSPDPDSCQDMSEPSYVPFTVTRTFQGVCPSGFGPVWRQFGYTTSTPTDTKVEFRFRSYLAESDGTCATLPAVTSGNAPAPAATASPTDDPEVCSVTSSANDCPIDLYSALGKRPDATAECLQMDAYGVPSETETPELVDWTVLHDCVPNE
jgi:hypothetical protein